MNILLDEHKVILIKLLQSKVDFILIGGYAVNYHGYGRTTGDMDVWLRPDNGNRDKLVPVLESLGVLSEDISVCNLSLPDCATQAGKNTI